MHEGVRRADRTVAVLSSAYLDSVFATAEWQAAWREDPLGEQRKLLVFRVADCDRPGLLAGVVSVDLFGVGKAAARARIRSAIRGAVTGRAKPADEPDFPPEARAARRSHGFRVRCPRCGTCRRGTRTSPAGRLTLAASGRGWQSIRR